MKRTPIDLPFNKDFMTAGDLKKAAGTLQDILQQYDRFHDEPEELMFRIMQIRGVWNPNA